MRVFELQDLAKTKHYSETHPTNCSAPSLESSENAKIKCSEFVNCGF